MTTRKSHYVQSQRPNHALQQPRHDAGVCNPCVPSAGSLSLGRYPTLMRFLCLPVLLALTVASPAKSRTESREVAAVSGRMQEFVNRKVIAGSVTLVTQHGKTVISQQPGARTSRQGAR